MLCHAGPAKQDTNLCARGCLAHGRHGRAGTAGIWAGLHPDRPQPSARLPRNGDRGRHRRQESLLPPWRREVPKGMLWATAVSGPSAALLTEGPAWLQHKQSSKPKQRPACGPLQAVAVPELQHLRNVVVFPKKGPRPHPNEISGSDLDGDHYFCSWRRNLIPPVRTARPMEFPPPTPKELDKVGAPYVVDGHFWQAGHDTMHQHTTSSDMHCCFLSLSCNALSACRTS